MIRMILVFVVLFVIIAVANLLWSTLDKNDKRSFWRGSLKAAIIASIVTAILFIITHLF